MNKFIQLALLLVTSLIGLNSTAAYASGSQKTYGHVCDIYDGSGLSCSSINNGYLIDKIYPDLTFRPHPSCTRGRGSNPNCGQVVNFFTATHTIFDVKNGEISKVKIEVSPTGSNLSTNYTFTSLSSTQAERNVLNELTSFRTENLDLDKRLKFTENTQGYMINENGETFEGVLSSYGVSSNQSTNSGGPTIGNCTTALDYLNNSLGPRDNEGCGTRLNTNLKNVAEEVKNDADQFFRNMKATLKTLFIDITLNGEGNTQKVSFKFKDNSVITLDITYNNDAEPGIKEDLDASYTSNQRTFNQYLNDLTNRSVNEIVFSGREISTVYGRGFNQCRTWILSLGVIQKVKVTVTRRAPDGRPIAWTVELVSQREISREIKTCG